MPITQNFLDTQANTIVNSAQDINDFFNNNYNANFIDWFNTSVAGKNYWGNFDPHHSAIKIADDVDAQTRFENLWSPELIEAAFGKTSITLLQFIALQSIINNETGGKNSPVTERVGLPGHQGIAYAFDSIPNIKQSYNTLKGNKTCFTLFNDTNYNTSFNTFTLNEILQNTTDVVWDGNTYPQATVSTSTNPNITGYVLEADFYKFRGRGFIQTTGRANYLKLVEFIMSYSGNNQIVLNAQMNWQIRSTDTDIIATMSSNAEWDDLFQNSNLLIPAKGIALHNTLGGDYLNNIDTTTADTAKATVRRVGAKISGSSSYADLYINRVIQIIEQL